MAFPFVQTVRFSGRHEFRSATDYRGTTDTLSVGSWLCALPFKLNATHPSQAFAFLGFQTETRTDVSKITATLPNAHSVGIS